MRRLALAGLCVAVICAPGFAQEAGRLIPRTLLLVVARQPNAHFSDSDALLIERSLHQRLQEAEPDLVMIDSPPAAGPDMSPESLGALATRAEADAWMLVTVGGDWTSAQIGVKAFDLLSKASVANVTATRASWGSPGGLAYEQWADIAHAVAGKFPPIENTAAEAAGQNLVQLTVSALPGSLVSGLGKKPLRVGPDGAVSVKLAPWHEYLLRATLADYVPVSRRLFLSEDREIRLAQRRSSRWALEASLTDSRAPGIDVTMAFPARSLFLRFGFTTYAVALSFDGTRLFLSDPLTDVILQAGLYISPEDQLFRLYAALGAFARVIHEAGSMPVFDPVAPLAAQVVVGTELSVSNRSRLFLEYTPTIYGTSFPDSLRASLGKDAPGWLFQGTRAVNLLSFRVGWRWQL